MTPTPAAPPPAPTPTPTLGRVARSGFLWQALAFGGARLSLLLSTIVLARVLGPTDFGLVALAVVMVLALTVVADLGVSQALVYQPLTRRRLGTATLLALGGSATLALVWAVSAPLVASATGHAGNGLMLASLGAVIVLTALGQVPDAVLRRELKFSRRLPAEISRGLGRGVVAIVLALNGFGPWSLVIGEIAGAAAFAVVSWVMAAPALPPVREWADAQQARNLLGFGAPAALNGALATAVLNVDYVIVAGMLGSTAVGIYFVGFRVPELLVLSVFQVFSQVAYPVYAKVHGDAERLRRAYLLSLRVQSTYGLVVGAALAAAAPVMVPVLFGEQYDEAVMVTQAIAAYVVFRSLTAGAVDVFKAVGRPQLGVLLGLARLSVLVPTLLLATRWEVSGVAAAQALVALAFVFLTLRVVGRLLGLQVGPVLRQFGTGVLAAGAAALAVATVGWWGGEPDLLLLVAQGAAAVLVAATTVWLVDRDLLVRAVRG